MAINTARDGFWGGDGSEAWNGIDTQVKQTISGLRVAQKVFGAKTLDATSVPADTFDPTAMTLTEGNTKPFIELAVTFTLTNGQVNNDPSGTAINILAPLAAKTLALAEDIIFFQGTDATLPSGVTIESGLNSFNGGILKQIAQPILINAGTQLPATSSGLEIYYAINNGLNQLLSQGQANPYSLILSTAASSVLGASAINSIPTITVLQQSAQTLGLTGGIYGSSALPPNIGLLVATAGNPTTIYIGPNDVTTEPTAKIASGLQQFRIFERVQIVAYDTRAFLALDFTNYLPAQAQTPASGTPQVQAPASNASGKGS
jgi:uncharacterized linocin/CFP29 family protein